MSAPLLSRTILGSAKLAAWRTAPSPTSSRPGSAWSSAASTPGYASAAAGAHFANPRNDFWRLLHAAGFTPRELRPEEQHEALEHGVGLTNAAYRTTKGSGDLRRGDFDGSAERLDRLRASCARLARVRRQGGLSRRVRRAAGAAVRRSGGSARRSCSSSRPRRPRTRRGSRGPERLRWFEELAARV